MALGAETIRLNIILKKSKINQMSEYALKKL